MIRCNTASVLLEVHGRILGSALNRRDAASRTRCSWSISHKRETENWPLWWLTRPATNECTRVEAESKSMFFLAMSFSWVARYLKYDSPIWNSQSFTSCGFKPATKSCGFRPAKKSCGFRPVTKSCARHRRIESHGIVDYRNILELVGMTASVNIVQSDKRVWL